jgi:hypothetical protein
MFLRPDRADRIREAFRSARASHDAFRKIVFVSAINETKLSDTNI